MDKRLSAERDVAGSNTGWTNAQGLDIYKWLDILDFSNKDEQPKAPSHSSCSDILLDVKESTLLLVKSKSRTDPGGVVQPYMGWVDNKGVDISWDVRNVSSLVTDSTIYFIRLLLKISPTYQ